MRRLRSATCKQSSHGLTTSKACWREERFKCMSLKEKYGYEDGCMITRESIEDGPRNSRLKRIIESIMGVDTSSSCLSSISVIGALLR